VPKLLEMPFHGDNTGSNAVGERLRDMSAGSPSDFGAVMEGLAAPEFEINALKSADSG
jgi:hypothetical protein